MGQHDDLRAGFPQLVQRRQRRPDPPVVGDLAVVQWDVEITADQDALAAQVSKIGNSFHAGQSDLPTSNARSTSRLL
jgi:hypothetical protein